jgi:hypothetical protein
MHAHKMYERYPENIFIHSFMLAASVSKGDTRENLKRRVNYKKGWRLPEAATTKSAQCAAL